MRRIGSKVVKCLVVAALCTLPMQGFAATGQNQVVSISIKPADGATGQNVLLGSGVKTGHIQDGAVTDAKIGGTISTDKLNVGTSAGTVAAGDHSHVISTVNIADGAVTDAKITGTISGSKLGAHGHNSSDIVGTINASNLPMGTASGTVAAGDHSHDSAYQKKYANVIVVAKSGGDFTDPLTAMQSITDASATSPYLIKLMPGIYNLGTNTLGMAPYVDIEGSGENITVIRGIANINAGWGVVRLIRNSELRNLTVDTSESSWQTSGIAISANEGNNVLSHVTITASAALSNYGFYAYGGDGNPTRLNDVTVLVSGAAGAYGVYAQNNNNVIMNNCRIEVSGPDNGNNMVIAATSQYGAKLTINNSSITAQGLYLYGAHALRSIESAGTIVRGSTLTVVPNTGIAIIGDVLTNVAYTQVDGVVGVWNPGKCIGVYDRNLNAVSCGQ